MAQQMFEFDSSKINGLKAASMALKKEMAADPSVVLMGHDVRTTGGGIGAFMGISDLYDSERCVHMPIAEAGNSWFALGAAVAGLRPVIDLAYSDFATLCSDAIINGAAKIRFNSRGKAKCPIVYFFGNGGNATYGGFSSGNGHEQSMENLFLNVPGLKVVAPYFPSDIYGLLRASIQDDDPVVFLPHRGSAGRGRVPGVNAEDLTPFDENHFIPLNNAANILREGSDVTIVAISGMVAIALQAAKELEKEGIHAEVIDPRVLVPLDSKKICDSVKKTGRLIIVQEAHRTGGFSGDILSAVMTTDAANYLKAPVKLCAAMNSPIPCGYTAVMMMPHKEDVIAAAKELLK